MLDQKVRVFTKPVTRLTPQEYEDCKNATLSGQGSMGMMSSQLDFCRRKPRKDRATLCYWGNELVGWALGFRNFDGAWEVYVYVHKNYRRMGVGTKLMRHVRMGRSEQLAINGHTDAAISFFSPLTNTGRAKDLW